MPTLTSAELTGILFVGDPHISSVKPGRRTDDDFMLTVCGKITEAVRIANDKKLLLVILGDLFHKPKDAPPVLLNRLIKALKGYHGKAIVLEGNHDKTETTLTEDTALSVLETCEIVDIAGEGWVRSYPFCNLIAVPHGSLIPDEVPAHIATPCNIMITHHDLGFEGAYPGSMEVKEIKNCGLVVNGHMHLTKALIKKGETVWCNPGNITRLSIDTINHIPSVWEWRPGSTDLTQIPLAHVKQPFDLTGRNIDAQNHALTFSDVLQTESSDVAKSEDGSILYTDLMALAKEEELEDESLKLILEVYAELGLQAPSTSA